MRYLLFIPFALLLGLAAGSWAPRQELTNLRREVEKLTQELESSGKTGKLSALNTIIKIPGNEGGRKPERTRAETPPPSGDAAQPAAPTNTTELAEGATNAPAQGQRRGRRRIMPDPKSKNFEADLQEAKELWQTRVEMARSQWLAKLALNDDQTEIFDTAFAEMNEKLYLTMQLVAEELRAGREMTNEAGIRIVNEVTTTLVETYDRLDRAVPPERRQELETMEMQDFIDPAAFEPLIDVSDKL
jgi:hypothetical protein